MTYEISVDETQGRLFLSKPVMIESSRRDRQINRKLNIPGKSRGIIIDYYTGSCNSSLGLHSCQIRSLRNLVEKRFLCTDFQKQKKHEFDRDFFQLKNLPSHRSQMINLYYTGCPLSVSKYKEFQIVHSHFFQTYHPVFFP